MDPRAFRNRLLVATQMWRESTHEPLPKLSAGEPAAQIEELERRLVEVLCREATAATARDVADRTWDLVHDRPDEDPVKQQVVECHEALARLTTLGD